MNAVYFEPEELMSLIKNAVSLGIKEAIDEFKRDPKKIVKLKEASEILNMAESTVRKWTYAGKINRAIPEVKGLRFTIQELERFASDYRQNKI